MNVFDTILIDPIHSQAKIFDSLITRDVWSNKYRHNEEAEPKESMRRVVDAVYAHESDPHHKEEAYEAMTLGLWNPGGRIHAGAGTSHRVTLFNCYVMQDMHDSMDAIADTLKGSMLTMQQGGGIGIDFSTLRPSGAYLERTGAVASGPLPFMEMWDSMCATILSSGSRRGAMMATMSDTHPDLQRFVEAKKTSGKLTNFNVSILVSDAFMDAVRNDQTWDLYFSVPPYEVARGDTEVPTFTDDAGVVQYVYARVPAVELWESVVRTTYEFSEPGIIFIDRVNDLNNLRYVERINCTNPCGEQGLPANGCCNLGCINLARLVTQPFSYAAEFDYSLLRRIARVGTRFLDNVIDITNYPLEAQREEEEGKRRIGLGVTGLADAMAMMRIRYGSQESQSFTRNIFRNIAESVYETSVELADERGPFPLFDREKYCNSPFIRKLPENIQKRIYDVGIRNGVLLTVAPTGTTSIYYGNVSAGIEPAFAHTYKRKVLQKDNSRWEYEVKGYCKQLYEACNGNEAELPEYMVTTADLTVTDHVRIQAAAQEWVDASISKTVNCPTEMTFEAFKEVYNLAYALGCKGCTTYRPSEVRGSVLSTGTEAGGSGDDNYKAGGGSKKPLLQRPKMLKGVTYKIKWPTQTAAIYATINSHPVTERPFEVFFSSKDATNQEWMTSLSLLISSIMRANIDYDFVADELMQIASAHDGCWIEGKYYGSLPAYLGQVLKEHLEPTDRTAEVAVAMPAVDGQPVGVRCPNCGAPLVAEAACLVCKSCAYSRCD